jgi:hypothetical protein
MDEVLRDVLECYAEMLDKLSACHIATELALRAGNVAVAIPITDLDRWAETLDRAGSGLIERERT